jgi:hypothetical protein
MAVRPKRKKKTEQDQAEFDPRAFLAKPGNGRTLSKQKKVTFCTHRAIPRALGEHHLTRMVFADGMSVAVRARTA